MTIEQFTQFMGWCLLLNVIFLLITTIGFKLGRQKVVEIHSRMFGVEAAELSKIYFTYLANYKLLIMVFILIPYIALLIMV